MNKSGFWIEYDQYDAAIAASNETGKPILIYFHSESSPGCQNIASNIFRSDNVDELILENTIPVWVEVESKKPDPRISELVGSHIFIMSPVLQLISSTGDIHHKIIGAPLHTRLSKGYTRVHSDIEGSLTADEFRTQLNLGLGKWALFNKRYSEASEVFSSLLSMSKESCIATNEAEYWKGISDANGVYPEDSESVSVTGLSPLAKEVKLFCDVLKDIHDDELMIDWKGEAVEGWANYTDCLREFVFGVYQSIIDFGIDIKQSLAMDGCLPQSKTSEITREWQTAFRTMQGLVVGLKGSDLDSTHLGRNFSLGKQRTIRNNLVHCVMAEYWAHGTSIRQTLKNLRENVSKEESNRKPIVNTIEKAGMPPINSGTMNELLNTWEEKHLELITEFSAITDEELEASYGWWENNEISIRFRLNRLCWHIYDHCAVIETICERIGRTRSEAERLVMLLYTALGKAEGELLSLAKDEQDKFSNELVSTLKERRLTLQSIYK